MLRKIENPMPHFVEAADAAQSYLKAQREHVVLLTEIQAHAQSRRVIWLAAAGAFALIGLFWATYWAGWALREQGLSPGWLALGWLAAGIVVAAICAAFASHAARSARPKHESPATPIPRQESA